MGLFYFFINNEVNEDAANLAAITELVFSRYCNLKYSKLEKALANDFLNCQVYIDKDGANFYYKKLPYFQFLLSMTPNKEKLPLFLSVLGKGKYAGFGLHVNDQHWSYSVKDAILFNATGGAKKLAKIMNKKYGVEKLQGF